MSMQYIRDYYGVPAKRGGRVRYMGDKTGKITGTKGPHLRIRLDGEKVIHSYHPRWNIEYEDSEETE